MTPDAQNAAELKPCPFCGGEATPEMSGYRIVCANRKCAVQIEVIDDDPDVAAQIWNTRATPAAAAVMTEGELRERAADRSITETDREYASELMADLANEDLPKLECAARWFRKARVETLLPFSRLAANATSTDEAWRPIETAPKDGCWVILYAPASHGLSALTCPAQYHAEGGWCVDELREATHWRPLPAPPHAPASAVASDDNGGEE